MSAYPCSSHGAKIKGKLATVYSAWFDSEGERQAWKQRLCAPCLTTLADSFKAALSTNASDLTVCPMCGQDSSTVLDPIYLNVYLPKRDPEEFALCTCSSCAPSLRSLLLVGAQRLTNRGTGSGAPGGAPDPDPWDKVLA